ncbi:hypothetical protein EMPS_06751 [Entomortierella parvispora]|uniref:Uncharacterized protein n=1 Tax=Entomortierella parvispora TaxID=205924 RepID=A0A9P3LXR9_9FUNG|nr:hypothetical protein EMPS_06751 [Entomortierella parvispora]
MATEEDSSVLQQLIDQIEGELSTFNPVGGNGSEQSLTSWTASQGSLISLEEGKGGSAATHQPMRHSQHNLPTSATSAIFGRSYRSGRASCADAMVPGVNGGHGALRAPQNISSTVASPISPGVPKNNILQSGQGTAATKELQEQEIGLNQDITLVADIQGGVETNVAQREVSYDDNIKVDVTDLFESFGGALKRDQTTGNTCASDGFKVNPEESTADLGVRRSIGQSAPKLLELSFSSNDLTSLWTLGNGTSIQNGEGGAEKRIRSHTFNGLSKLDERSSSDSTQFNASSHVIPQNAVILERSPSLEIRDVSLDEDTDTMVQVLSTDRSDDDSFTGQEVRLVMQPGKPNEEQARLKEQIGASDPRKRLSLVTSGSGLAAAAEAAAASRRDTQRPASLSCLDLPSWDLAPLSPPIEVKEINSVQSAVPSPMTVRKEFADTQQQQQGCVHSTVDQNNINVSSPGSASLMTPTTPLTTREARILAGREALLRMSPDKSRVKRGTSASSTASSLTSSVSEPAKYNHREGGDSVGTEEASLSTSSTSSGVASSGVFGAILQRGESPFKQGEVSAERQTFPDQSLRPIPLKAYRVRKLTLKERNQVYAEAVQDFTRAKVGLDVWALRSMMQDRPALMKDPPTIVKAVAGKYGPGQAPTLSQHHLEPFSKGNSDGAGRLTPAGLPLGASASGVHGGIGARIKNAGKRFSMDISASVTDGSNISEAYSHYQHPAHAIHLPSAGGSLFYKQKIVKSAVELESWSSSRSRAMSDSKASTAQDSSSSASTRGGAHPPGVSPGSSPLKRMGSGNTGHLFSTSLRAHTKSESPTTLVSFSSNGSTSSRSNSTCSVRGPKKTSLLSEDTANVGGVPVYYDSTGGIRPMNAGAPMSPGSGFLERPIRKSLTGRSSRRPMSMMIIPNRDESEAASTSDSISTLESRTSLGTQSSSMGSISSESNIAELRLQENQGLLERHGGSENNVADGSTRLVHTATGLPFADETTSKDEVYSPLTSPIMIPVVGFQQQGQNQRSNPQMGVGRGLTRPLTYAGASSSSTISTSASLVMSPVLSSASTIPSPPPRESGRSQSIYNTSSPTAESGLVMGGPIRSEADQRHATSSFSSLASFAKYQKRDAFSTGTTPKRLSKKDKKKEEMLQQKQQRYSVSSAAAVDNLVSPGASSKNEYVTEQSLDRLGDVLPHVDRDRLSIYLQRSFGDEMVAIGLAMADLRNGLI